MTEPELALPDGYRELLEDLKRTVAAARSRTVLATLLRDRTGPVPARSGGS